MSPQRHEDDPPCASSTECVCVSEEEEEDNGQNKAWLSPQQLLCAAAPGMSPLRLDDCMSLE